MAKSTVRAGNLFGYANLIADLGGNPEAAFAACGEVPEILDDESRRIPYHLANALLVEGCRASGHQDFALRLASRQGPQILGAISELLIAASHVGEALETITEYFALHNDGARAILTLFDDYVIWSLEIEVSGIEAWHHADLGAGMAMRIMQHLVGEDWRPQAVHLAHRKPRETWFYEKTFLRPVDFDQERNAIVIERSDLDRPVPTANKERYKILLQEAQERLNSREPSAEARVTRMVFEALSNGSATAASVAGRMGMTVRGMQRVLQRSDCTFRSILTKARMELATRYLAETDIPICQLTDLLGYSEQPAFSRAFKKANAGKTPTAWRKASRQSWL